MSDTRVPQRVALAAPVLLLFGLGLAAPPAGGPLGARISLPSGVQQAPPLLLAAATGNGLVEPSRGRGPLVLFAAPFALALALAIARRAVRV